MKFTVADLLDHLSTTDTVALAKLEKSLGLTTKACKQQLRIGLDALARLGLVEEEGEGLRSLDSSDRIAARLRCSSKGFCFALREDGGEDIYIRDHQLNHAWNGDRVLVKITREGGRRRSPEGGVQCILERHTPSLLAQVERQDGQLVAVPLDDRLLTTVALPESDATHLEPSEEAVVEVTIDRFPVAQFGPTGHVVRSLPVHGGETADTDLLQAKHRLHERPASPRATLKQPVAKGRADLTALPTLIFDIWETAEAPVLPALSLEEREGGWRLWVHSPAVAERIGMGNSLDTWLREQGEAICLGRRWLPLLPAALTKACGLRAGESQSALSVCLDLDAAGSLEHFRFTLSQITPDARVDQAAMAALAERKPKARTVPAALKPLKAHLPLVEQLVQLSGLLRQQRLAAGSIDLDLPMPAIDSLGDLRIPSPDAAHQGWLVERPTGDPVAILREAVLVAQRALGRHLLALELPALYAVNPAPEASEINDVAKAALALEIPMELSADGNASAAELAAAFAATDRGRPLQQQLREALCPVQLTATAGSNAVAGEPTAVAPWCCPGLHYADLWNQHLLVSLLVDGKDRPSVRHKIGADLASDTCHGTTDWPLLTPGQLAPYQQALEHGLAQRLNGRSRFLQEFKADALALAQARHTEPLVGRTLPGVISGVQSYGFFVEVPPSQVEGLVHVSSLKDDWYEYRSRQNRLVGRKFRRTYMVGDRVDVEIQKVDALRHQIDLVVLQPENFDQAGEDDGSGDDAPDSSESPALSAAEG
ncbi:RNB domain-containing ribonuclease [Synechococcus sp. CCY 9618]|uniref:RNB domain-containing ribonuclease n=1 Tax=Synechococcus sp. CCY 9618 TaxID=2815602 RepID=UPI001C245E40|nr:RNB domain-containing ribonuclease [Synechococcus sp. CCY 9618]